MGPLVALVAVVIVAGLFVMLRRKGRPAPVGETGFFPADLKAHRAEAVRRRADLVASRAQVAARYAKQPARRCVITNRVLLLGLDALYREVMKRHEKGELLACVRALTATLGVAPAGVPVEGYYDEDADLKEYFLRMRALQETDQSERPRVAGRPEYRRLLDVTSSPLFGRAAFREHLFPVGRDPLARALLDSEWTPAQLVERAYRVADETDDYSLVGLAARLRDALILTALRESVVLYAEVSTLASIPSQPKRREYVWEVDPELAHQAARFVATFNDLFGEALPDPVPGNAEDFFDAYDEGNIVGRCVRIGKTAPPEVRHYHWAIYRGVDLKLAVQDFWHVELWSTSRYRSLLKRDGKPQIP